jgi:hypothetical protein
MAKVKCYFQSQKIEEKEMLKSNFLGGKYVHGEKRL